MFLTQQDELLKRKIANLGDLFLDLMEVALDVKLENRNNGNKGHSLPRMDPGDRDQEHQSPVSPGRCGTAATGNGSKSGCS